MSLFGLVPNLPLLDYLRDPCAAPSLSASLAHTLLTRSPRHAWHESPRLNPDWQHDDSEPADLGTIAHALLLEGDRSRIVVVEADDWRTKVARKARDAAHAVGKLPILPHRLVVAETMASDARSAIEASELADAFRHGRPEVSLFWEEDGIWCRARPDWMSDDGRFLLDYKTHGGSVEPNAWARGPLLANGYDLQCVHAMRGTMALAKPRDVSLVFVCQEADPPYAVSLIGLAPAFLAFAEAKLASARAMWRWCVRRGEWPSYPSRVAWAEPPAWATFQWETQQAMGQLPVDDGRPLAGQLFGKE